MSLELLQMLYVDFQRQVEAYVALKREIEQVKERVAYSRRRVELSLESAVFEICLCDRKSGRA